MSKLTIALLCLSLVVAVELAGHHTTARTTRSTTTTTTTTMEPFSCDDTGMKVQNDVASQLMSNYTMLQELAEYYGVEGFDNDWDFSRLLQNILAPHAQYIAWFMDMCQTKSLPFVVDFLNHLGVDINTDSMFGKYSAYLQTVTCCSFDWNPDEMSLAWANQTDSYQFSFARLVDFYNKELSQIDTLVQDVNSLLTNCGDGIDLTVVLNEYAMLFKPSIASDSCNSR